MGRGGGRGGGCIGSWATVGFKTFRRVSTPNWVVEGPREWEDGDGSTEMSGRWSSAHTHDRTGRTVVIHGTRSPACSTYWSDTHPGTDA